MVAIGKDRNGYLLNRANLGGISAPVAQGVVAPGQVINSAATYRTSQGTFVVLRSSNIVTAFKITPTSPPTIAMGWTVSSTGRTSPFVTSTDGTSNPIVWAYGHGTNQRLLDTTAKQARRFSPAVANDTNHGTRTFNTGIAARGRIYIAGDKVYAFALPQTPPSQLPPPHLPQRHSYSAATATATPTATATATIPPTPTPTLSPGITPSPTPTPTSTATATATATVAPTATPSSTPAVSATPTATPAQAVNLSTRMFVQAGDNAGIGGFIISGNAPKHVLVRVIGPSLTQFGVSQSAG